MIGVGLAQRARSSLRVCLRGCFSPLSRSTRPPIPPIPDRVIALRIALRTGVPYRRSPIPFPPYRRHDKLLEEEREIYRRVSKQRRSRNNNADPRRGSISSRFTFFLRLGIPRGTDRRIHASNDASAVTRVSNIPTTPGQRAKVVVQVPSP